MAFSNTSNFSATSFLLYRLALFCEAEKVLTRLHGQKKKISFISNHSNVGSSRSQSSARKCWPTANNNKLLIFHIIANRRLKHTLGSDMVSPLKSDRLVWFYVIRHYFLCMTPTVSTKTVKRLLNSTLWNPLRHCSPLALFPPSLSNHAMSIPATSSVLVHSCNFSAPVWKCRTWKWRTK